jgi:hypothetical protein
MNVVMCGVRPCAGMVSRSSVPEPCHAMDGETICHGTRLNRRLQDDGQVGIGSRSRTGHKASARNDLSFIRQALLGKIHALTRAYAELAARSFPPYSVTPAVH